MYLLIITIAKHRLNLSVKAKRCRIYLSKRHHLTSTNIKFHRPIAQQVVDKEKVASKKKKGEIAEADKKKKKLVKKMVPSHTVEAGSKNSPADSSSQPSLDSDSRPQDGQKKRGSTKRNQVVASSDSESTISLPIKDFAKKQRTQRPTKKKKSCSDKVDSHPGPIPAIPAGGEGISIVGGPKVHPETHTGEEHIAVGPGGHERTGSDQDEQAGGDVHLDDRSEENQGYETRMDQEGPNMEDWVDKDERIVQDESSSQMEKEAANMERSIVVRSGPEQPAQQTITYTGQGIFAPIQIKEINWVTHFLPKNAPEEKGKGMLEVVDRPNLVEEHSRLVLNSAWDAVSNIMADFDEWTHFRTARRSLLMYKLYETEVQKLFDEHLRNFKINVSYVNHDYLCIRFLNKELREIATQHRAQRMLAGLPIFAPEASFVGATSDQSQTLVFEFSSQADHKQEHARESSQRQEQLEEVVRSVVNIEEPADRTREPQAPKNERQTHDEQIGATQNLLVNSRNHRVLMFVTSPPASPHTSSKLEEVEKVVASLDSRIMSIDSWMLSMDSKVKFVDSRLGSVDSKIEQLLNLQYFIKHDMGTSRSAFYDKIDTVAGNVKSSQTSLETTVGDAKKGKVAKAVVDRGKDLEDKEKVQEAQEIRKEIQLDQSDKIWTKLTTLDVETRSEQSQAGQGKTSSEYSGTLVKDNSAKKTRRVENTELQLKEQIVDNIPAMVMSNQLEDQACKSARVAQPAEC
ncbi:hypothetical protein F511_21394 [Dorcoceras hygrometricum]|uniref:Uncharacterized protein n=1 Tax=Dorcoceras hygrometricum TaxID=472368 RepID=A0A2Z7CGZ8_9LAMI|nr:hypothetical protein F511_21394 [Dorcoceras hygrometricum]